MRNLRKLLSVLVVVAMLLTSFVPAFAASSFTYEAQANTLKDLGLFKGVSTDPNVFDPALDLSLDRQSGIVMMLRLVGQADAAEAMTAAEVQSALAKYTDTKDISDWAAKSMAYAIKNNLVKGMTETTLAPKEKFAGKMFATLILRNIGYDVTAEGYNTAAATLASAGGLTSAEAVKFNEKQLIRDDMVGMSFGSLKALHKTTNKTIIAALVEAGKVTRAKAETAGLIPPSVSALGEVKAIGANKLQVGFAGAVDATKAVISVKKGTIIANVSKVTFAADNKSAVIELASKITEGDYTISVTGIATNPLTAKITTIDEKVSKIAFDSEKVSLDRADATSATIVASISVFNQYNEDITKNVKSDANLIITPGKGTAGSIDDDGVFTIKVLTGTYALDEKVAISALYSTTGAFASALMTVSNQAQVSDLKAKSLYNVNDVKLAADTIATDPFYILVDVKDQYGTEITNPAYINSDVIVSSSDSTIAQVAGTPNFTTLTINSEAQIALPIVAPTTPVGGKAIITMISKTNGKMATFEVNVKEAIKVDSLTLSAPDLAVAGEETIIPFTAVDQFGNAVTDINVMNKVTLTSSAGTASFRANYVTGKAELVLDASAITAKTSIAITAQTVYTTTSPTKVSTIMVNVVDPAVPAVVTGYTGDVKTTLLRDGGNTQASKTYIKIKDNYGRDMNMNSWSGTGYQFTMTSGDAAIVSVKTNPGVVVANGQLAYTWLADTGSYPSFYANTKGATTLTLQLYKKDAVTLQYVEIPGSAYVANINVVEKEAIVSYSVDDIATMYIDTDAYYAYNDAAKAVLEPGNTRKPQNDSHSADVKVNGVLANGTKVSIPNTNQAGTKFANFNVTTTVSQMTYESQNNNARIKVADQAGLLATFDSTTTEKTGTAVITVFGANGVETFVKSLKYTTVAPVITTLELRSDSDLRYPSKYAYDPNSITVPAGNLVAPTVQYTGQIAPIGSYKNEGNSVVSISFSDLNATVAGADIHSRVTSFVNRAVKMTDQYGKAMVSGSSSTAALITSYTDLKAIVMPVAFVGSNVFVSNIKDASGSATKTVNGTKVSYAENEIAQGFSFSATAITSNGNVISFKVVLK